MRDLCNYEKVHESIQNREILLKAAGTPIINAFPVVNSLKLTLLPGLFSTRTSRFGSLSPTLMKARAELWKDRAGRVAPKATRRRANCDAIVELSNRNLRINKCGFGDEV